MSSRRPRRACRIWKPTPNSSGMRKSSRKQPGWRFDLIVLGSESQPMPEKGSATGPPKKKFAVSLGDVERMLQAGFVQQALIAAWAVLEAAMRRRLQANGEKAGWGSSPRTMLNELYSAGVLQSSVFRRLEGSSR